MLVGEICTTVLCSISSSLWDIIDRVVVVSEHVDQFYANCPCPSLLLRKLFLEVFKASSWFFAFDLLLHFKTLYGECIERFEAQENRFDWEHPRISHTYDTHHALFPA